MPSVTETTMTDIDPTFFERRHPSFESKRAHWNFLEQTYYGGRDWFASNVHKYYREGAQEYAQRVERAYRFNHTREIVDLVTKYVFKGQINRSGDAPEQVRQFWKKTTRGGRDISAFMREVSQLTSIFGQPYIVVDTTVKAPDSGGPVSQADLERMGGRVYAYAIKPQNALDMSFDEEGNLNWILFAEVSRKDDDFFSEQVTVNQYRLWTREGWYLYEVVKQDPAKQSNIKVISADQTPMVRSSASPGTATQKLVVKRIAEGHHGLGVVPVIVPRERHSDDKYTAPGLIDDIAYLDRAVANYLSNLDAIIQDQTFSTLTIPAQALNTAEAGEGVREKVIEMGTNRIVVYDAEAGTGPSYISPDPSQVNVILGVITKVITEIYHSVGMAGERTKMDNAAGIDNSSGVAKAYDFDRMNTMLKSKADMLANVEKDLVRLVHLWTNKTMPEGANYVQYPDDFDTRNLYDEFDVANRLALLDAPDKIRQHQMLGLIDKLFPNLTKELRSEIEKQIKEWPPEEAVSIRAPSRLQDRTVPPEENVQGQANPNPQD